jgi:uncharacterized damage-inducible protein DinB
MKTTNARINREYSPVRVKKILLAFLICVLVPTALVFAQGARPSTAVETTNPLIAESKMFYAQMKDWLLRSAEKMPEENYSFKATDAVRSYGQIIGHIADRQYTFCSVVRGEKYPNLKIEQTKIAKADLIAALKDAFAYCDKAYVGITDASAIQMVTLGSQQHPKLGVLEVNIAHNSLHYGNLITYMRLKNIVPPSTEDMEGLQKKKVQ